MLPNRYSTSQIHRSLSDAPSSNQSTPHHGDEEQGLLRTAEQNPSTFKRNLKIFGAGFFTLTAAGGLVYLAISNHLSTNAPGK